MFRRYVGVGPKWVLQRYRMHEAAERMLIDPEIDLARLGLDLGYADQAHFGNDFHARTGRLPRDSQPTVSLPSMPACAWLPTGQ